MRTTSRPSGLTAKVLIILAALPLCVLGGYRAGKELKYDRVCGGHLKRAANANSVELAVKELRTAVGYLEEHGQTSGNTALFYQTPADDVGYWYGNLKGALTDLESLPADAPHLETSNMLIKLRETLLDHDSDGESLSQPSGVAIAPHNRLIALGFLAFTILFCAVAWWGWSRIGYLTLRSFVAFGATVVAAFLVPFFVFLS